MRYRRLSFVVGWAAVALLAIAGFAAFSDPGPSSEEVRVEAAEASMGHTSGAYAGLGFAFLGRTDAGNAATLEASAETADDVDAATEDEEDAGTSTVASPASGWLSEVEVRAVVSLYFADVDVNRAIRVAWCESRFDPEATDLRTGAVGLFKHLPRYWEERAANAGFTGAPPTNPEASVAAAAWEVYEGGGWDVFSCRG